MFMTDFTQVYYYPINQMFPPQGIPNQPMMPMQGVPNQPMIPMQGVPNQPKMQMQEIPNQAMMPMQGMPNPQSGLQMDLSGFGELKNAAMERAGDMVSGIKGKMSGFNASDAAGTVIARTGDAISLAKDKIAESGIKEKAADAAGAFAASSSEMFQVAKQIAAESGSIIKEKASDAAGSILARSGDAVRLAKEKVQDADIKGKIRSIGYFFRGVFETFAEKIHNLFQKNEQSEEHSFTSSSEAAETVSRSNHSQIVMIAAIAVLLAGGGIAAGLLIAKSIRQNSVQESTPTVSTTAVSNPNQAKLEKASAAYTTILREYMRSELYYTDPYDGPMYDLADMNQDGIPELVISYCSYGNCKVYSFVNDAATCLIDGGGENGQIAYFPSQQLVIDFWNQEGSTDVNIYSFTKSEFRLLQSMESAWDEPIYYKIDGKNVSEAEYTRIITQYENNMASAKYAGRQYSFPASPEQLTVTIAAK